MNGLICFTDSRGRARSVLATLFDLCGRMRSMLAYVPDAVGRARSALTTLYVAWKI